MIKIYYNNSSIKIIKEYPNKKEKHDYILKINACDGALLKMILKKYNEKETLFNFKNLKKEITVISAAGGIVEKKGKILFIFKKKKWDLPKGKLDKNEIPEATAIREVKEECNVEAKVVKKIGKTRHFYLENKKLILKEVIWYQMKLINDDHACPQYSEKIEKICWWSLDEIKQKVFKNTYPSIKNIYLKYLKVK